MPNTHSTLTSLFSDIADSIRAKTGSNSTIVADDFPDAIDAIPTGGSSTTPWWVAYDEPQLLHTATYTLLLSSTNYSSLTPSTTSQTLTQPATSYTASASTSVVYDRWGNGYNSGSALDFSQYNYLVISEQYVDIAYTTTESTMGLAHASGFGSVYIYSIGQYPRASSGNIIYPTSTTYGTTTAASCGGYYSLEYRNASNTKQITQTTYGISVSPQTPSFASTSSLTSNYINFRSPTWAIRTSANYMSQDAWQYVDAANTTLYVKQRLYRVKKSGLYENITTRAVKMADLHAFQPD